MRQQLHVDEGVYGLRKLRKTVVQGMNVYKICCSGSASCDLLCRDSWHAHQARVLFAFRARF